MFAPPPTSPPSVLSHWPGRDCWGVWGELQEENQAFHHAYWTWIHVWNSAGQAKCNPICCCTRWLNGCWSHYTQMHKCAVFTPACFIFHLICVFICVFFFFSFWASLNKRLLISACGIRLLGSRCLLLSALLVSSMMLTFTFSRSTGCWYKAAKSRGWWKAFHRRHSAE